MQATTHPKLRNTAVCILAAAISLPSLAFAGWFGQGLGGSIHTIKTQTGIVVTNIRDHHPLAQAAKKDSRNLSNTAQQLGGDIKQLPVVQGAQQTSQTLFNTVQQLHVLKQLTGGVQLVRQVEKNYSAFTSPGECSGTCASFRGQLQNIFASFLSLVQTVPALENRPVLTKNLTRAADLIDYIPPRALYLMYKSLAPRITQLQNTADDLRQTLASLPTLESSSGFNLSGTGTAICGWVGQSNKPFLKLFQARLQYNSWVLTTAASMIPTIDVSGHAGAAAGVAVADGTASAGVSVAPTDEVKTMLTDLASVFDQLNWSIKLNILRAQVVCSVASGS